MDDALTRQVVEFQERQRALEEVREQVMLEAFAHLNRYRRKGEDEISEFLLSFHGRIEGLLGRFVCRGLPFRHYLLRTLRWQWNTFRADRARERRLAWLTADAVGWDDPAVAEPSPWEFAPETRYSAATLKRLVLLAFKAAPELEDEHLVALSQRTGADLTWLRACRQHLCGSRLDQRGRRDRLAERRGVSYFRRLVAEDDARREADPERRQACERRARLYQRRLASLRHQTSAIALSPSHLEVADLLGMPKGTVDSGLYHLKRELATVYNGRHDHPSRDQQRPQKAGI